MALVTEEPKTLLPPLPKLFKYHVLFSYAGPWADYIKSVQAALPKEVKAFNYKQGGIWGRKLEKELERIYTKEALFCIILMSREYLESSYTKKELLVVNRVEKKKPGYMLPVVLDGTIVPEIKDLAWLDGRMGPEELAGRIVQKLCDPPPKPWWFYWSKELKAAAAAVLLAVILLVLYLLPSRTSLKSADANEQAIVAHVTNFRPKSATLVGQRLKFGALPIEDTELRLGKSVSATIAPGARDMNLITLQLLSKCDADGFRPKKDKIEALLDQQPVTLEIDIRESDDAPGKSRRQSATFPAAHLKPLVRRLVSGYDTPCT